MDSSQPQSLPTTSLPDADGNYDSRALKALRTVWEDYCDEVATAENVMAIIADIGRFSQAQLMGLEEQVKRGISNPDNESFSLIFEAFELVLEACDFLAYEFVDDLPEDVEEPEEGFFDYGFQLMQDATNQMMEGHKLAMEHLQAMSMVSCPFCAHSNSRDDQKCGRCGRALPTAPQAGGGIDLKERQGLEQGGQAQQGETTKNYAQTFQMLEAWKAGAVSPEQLGDFLHQLEASFGGHLAETDKQEKMIAQAPAHQQHALMQALQKTREGLRLSLEAVTKMKSAFELEDDRYLFFGLTDLEAATKVVLEGYWDNKAASKS